MYETLSLKQLADIGKARGLKRVTGIKKNDLINKLLELDLSLPYAKPKKAAEDEGGSKAGETRIDAAEDMGGAGASSQEAEEEGGEAERLPRNKKRARGGRGKKANAAREAAAEEQDRGYEDPDAEEPEFEGDEAARGDADGRYEDEKDPEDAEEAYESEDGADADEWDEEEDSERHGGRRSQRKNQREKGRKKNQGKKRGKKKGADAEDGADEAAEAAEGEDGKKEPPRLQSGDPNFVCGTLEIMADGTYGFLHDDEPKQNARDVYVSRMFIHKYHLRTGDRIEGVKGKGTSNSKNESLIYAYTINGYPAEEEKNRVTFEHLTPIFPDRRIKLEHEGGSVAMRVVDLISPIGRGQRGMIVSPPKAGKTTLLKDIAHAILAEDPESHLMILLVDERPEEVTDMRESVQGVNVKVISSTFDETPEHHRKVAEQTIERAKRLVELGEDVVILLDSITRLTRANNVLVPPSGRTLSGGLDPTALNMPKRFFGAARNMREGGSLTILATALIDTGSKMDDVVYEEFKGTGNMELILDRKLQERRIFPAIDIARSGTRREDLLLTTQECAAVNLIRKRLNGQKAEEATEALLNAFTKLPTNEQVVRTVLTRWNQNS